jgi:hypothetical protein
MTSIVGDTTEVGNRRRALFGEPYRPMIPAEPAPIAHCADCKMPPNVRCYRCSLNGGTVEQVSPE